MATEQAALARDRGSKILQTSDIIFPTASTVSVHSHLACMKRATRSITNRLRSIERDANFVRWVAAHYGRTSTAPSHCGGYDGVSDYLPGSMPLPSEDKDQKAGFLPVIANERCGSWYVPPREKTGGSSYWKSTDGHWGVWAFSLRRLNIGVLDVLGSSGDRGAIVVDSTRQGKQLPDAFSKTVPIWCAVMNRLLFPEDEWIAYHEFERCMAVVSESEAAQITAKLPALVDAVRELGLDCKGLRDKLGKPVRCFWVVRGLGLMPPTPSELSAGHAVDGSMAETRLDFRPLYLCMASEYQESATESSYSGYVQGAGDDAEAWACGLTPELFWKYREELLDTDVPEEDIPFLIEKLVAEEKHPGGREAMFEQTCVLAGGRLVLGRLPRNATAIPGYNEKDIAILCSSKGHINLAGLPEERLLQLGCGEGKLGSRNLRVELDRLGPFLEASKNVRKAFICCDTGRDLSVGVALAIMCLYLDDGMSFFSTY